MNKIDKNDLQNISLIKKELKSKEVISIKIKKGDYEIELSAKSSLEVDPSTTTSILKNEKLEKIDQKENLIKEENIIKSPMVGVAYLSADPKSPPYIKVGQHVKQGDIILLIEAMKTFNEVKAPKSGVIKKINILNSQPVEFGEDLIIFE